MSTSSNISRSSCSVSLSTISNLPSTKVRIRQTFWLTLGLFFFVPGSSVVLSYTSSLPTALARTLGYPLQSSLLPPGQFSLVTLVSPIFRQSQNFEKLHSLRDLSSNFSKMTGNSWIQIPLPSNFQMGFGEAAFLERQSGSKGSKPQKRPADSRCWQINGRVGVFPFNEVHTFQTSGLLQIHGCGEALTSSWRILMQRFKHSFPNSSPNIPKTQNGTNNKLVE